MIKAVIFDCFGVVRSDNLQNAYTKMGGDFDTDFEFIIDTIETANRGEIQGSAPVLAQKLGISEMEWRHAVDSGSVIDLEVLEYVTELRQSYKTAMLTNIGKAGVRRLFDDGFLERYFDVVVESAIVGFAKPEAQAYEITADRLGVRVDECVFTDDRQNYVDGAIAVGMHAFLFTGLEKFKSDLEALLSDPR